MAVDTSRDRRWLWAANLAGPLAFLANLQVEYALVWFSCLQNESRWLNVAPVVMLLLTILAGMFAITRLRLYRNAEEEAGLKTQLHFMAVLAVATNILFFGAILAQWGGNVVFHPCER